MPITAGLGETELRPRTAGPGTSARSPELGPAAHSPTRGARPDDAHATSAHRWGSEERSGPGLCTTDSALGNPTRGGFSSL